MRSDVEEARDPRARRSDDQQRTVITRFAAFPRGGHACEGVLSPGEQARVGHRLERKQAAVNDRQSLYDFVRDGHSAPGGVGRGLTGDPQDTYHRRQQAATRLQTSGHTAPHIGRAAPPSVEVLGDLLREVGPRVQVAGLEPVGEHPPNELVKARPDLPVQAVPCTVDRIAQGEPFLPQPFLSARQSCRDGAYLLPGTPTHSLRHFGDRGFIAVRRHFTKLRHADADAIHGLPGDGWRGSDSLDAQRIERLQSRLSQSDRACVASRPAMPVTRLGNVVDGELFGDIGGGREQRPDRFLDVFREVLEEGVRCRQSVGHLLQRPRGPLLLRPQPVEQSGHAGLVAGRVPKAQGALPACIEFGREPIQHRLDRGGMSPPPVDCPTLQRVHLAAQLEKLPIQRQPGGCLVRTHVPSPGQLGAAPTVRAARRSIPPEPADRVGRSPPDPLDHARAVLAAMDRLLDLPRERGKRLLQCGSGFNVHALQTIRPGTFVRGRALGRRQEQHRDPVVPRPLETAQPPGPAPLARPECPPLHRQQGAFDTTLLGRLQLRQRSSHPIRRRVQRRLQLRGHPEAAQRRMHRAQHLGRNLRAITSPGALPRPGKPLLPRFDLPAELQFAQRGLVGRRSLFHRPAHGCPRLRVVCPGFCEGIGHGGRIRRPVTEEGEPWAHDAPAPVPAAPSSASPKKGYQSPSGISPAARNPSRARSVMSLWNTNSKRGSST